MYPRLRITKRKIYWDGSTLGCCQSTELNKILCLFFDLGGPISSEVQQTIKNIEEMMKLTQDLVPKTEDVKAEEIGDMVESEMQMTSKAIEQAAKKIEVNEEFMSFA